MTVCDLAAPTPTSMRRLLFVSLLVLAGCAGTRRASPPIQLTLTYLTVDSPQAVRDSLIAWASAAEGLEAIADAGLAIRDTRPGSPGLTTVEAMARIDGVTEVQVGTEYLRGDGSGQPVAVEWLSQLGGTPLRALVLPADGSRSTCFSVEGWESDMRRQAETQNESDRPDPVPGEEIEERAPELIGGMAGLSRRLAYPEPMRRGGVEGPVLIRFVVDEEGAVECAEPILSPHPRLADAALEAVRASTFQPGTQRGVPVRVRFTLPVTFRLR